MERLQHLIGDVADSTQRLASASEQISAASEKQAEGATSQTQETEQGRPGHAGHVHGS
jgi:methyl-accepting chemotaxis protein